MENHPIEDLMQTAMYNIQDMIDVETIIGESIYAPNGTVIIPISKVCFGFAAGGSDFKSEIVEEYEKVDKTEKIKTKNPFGGGAGSGVKISPVGFLIVENKENSFPRFVPVENVSKFDKILDYVPDLIGKIEKYIYKKDECDDYEDIDDILEHEDVEEERETKTEKEKEIEKEYFKNETPVQSDGEDL